MDEQQIGGAGSALADTKEAPLPKAESLALIARVRRAPASAAQELADFPWSRWRPKVRATLIFIRRGDELLLIEKKTGLGAGKVNGPGGKLEPGETPRQCAHRELEEELSITTEQLTPVAQLRFLMSNYHDIECLVFFADGFSGRPLESPEARPFWCPLDAIPWAQMWEDDVLWLPRALEGERLRGAFALDGERLIAAQLDALPAPQLTALADQLPAEGALLGEER